MRLTHLLLRQLHLQAVDLLLQVLVLLLVGIDLLQTFSVLSLSLVLQALYDPLLRARAHRLRLKLTGCKGETLLRVAATLNRDFKAALLESMKEKLATTPLLPLHLDPQHTRLHRKTSCN